MTLAASQIPWLRTSEKGPEVEHIFKVSGFGPRSLQEPGGRAVRRVCPLVFVEVRASAEAPATGRARVGLLARVRPAVGAEVGAVVEALPALGTDIGPLAGVRPAVDDQAGALAEALSALGARVGLLARVNPLVCAEVGAVAEALPADQALVGPLPGVRTLVLGQVGRFTKGFATFGAHEWLVGPSGAPSFWWGAALPPLSSS